VTEVPELRNDGIILNAHNDSEVAAHLAGEDEETARRFGWWPARSTEKTVRAAYANWARNWQEDGPVRAFAARDPRSGALVGNCELRIGPGGTGEVSYWTHAGKRGRGYARNALALLVGYAASIGVTRLEAHVAPDNHASRHVAESAGFTQADTLTDGDGNEFIRYTRDTSGGTGGYGAILCEQAIARARMGRVSRIAYVSGRLGAGKSSLATPLAAELGYSLVTKDLIKETLHEALFVPGEDELDQEWSQRLGRASWDLLWALAARAGDMVIEANFYSDNEYLRGKLRDLGDRVVEVHCACPAEVAVARYNARRRHEVHWLTTATLATMDKYDRPVGVGSLITVDTTVPVDVASVAAEVRRLHGVVLTAHS